MSDVVAEARAAAMAAYQEGGSRTRVAAAFLKVVADSLKEYRQPEWWRLGGAFMGVPTFVAGVRLSEPVIDGWGQAISVDEVAVESAVVGIADAAAGLVYAGDPDAFGKAYLEAHPEGVRFCVASRAEHEEAERILNTYLLVDVEDYRGSCRVQCMYPLSPKSTGGLDPEWDEMVSAVERRDQEECERVRRTYLEEKVRWAQQLATKLSDLGIKTQVTSDGDLVYWTDEQYTWEPHVSSRANKDISRIIMAVTEWRRYSSTAESENEAIRAGAKPAFTVDGVDYFLPRDARKRGVWHVDVPEWAVAHLVGRGGTKVRALEAVLGCRVRLHGKPQERHSNARVEIHVWPPRAFSSFMR